MNLATSINVLYVTDEVRHIDSFKAIYGSIFSVFIAKSPDEGRTVLANELIHVILADQNMAPISGMNFLTSVVDDFPETERILLGECLDTSILDAINSGCIYRNIPHPLENEDLIINIKGAFEIYSLKKENKELTNALLIANKQLQFLLRQNLLS